MQKKLLILAVVVLILIGGAVFVWQKKTTEEVAQNQVKEETGTADNADTSDWKTYRNEQIGIQFNHPSAWGDIIVSKEVGCVDYYAEKIVIPEDVKDSCLHVTLSASNFNKGAFLSTEGAGYTDTEIPRGADWRFRLLSLSKEQENFCFNNPFILLGNGGGSLKDCESFKTTTELPVVKGLRMVPFSENEKMTIYFIRTNHPVYYDVVVSAQYLNGSSPTAESDVRKLVETIESL